MLDIKRIREDFDNVKKAVESRGKGDYNIGHAIELDDRRRDLLSEVEALKAKQNRDSKQIPKMKKAGEDTTELMAEMKKLSEQYLRPRRTGKSGTDGIKKNCFSEFPILQIRKSPVGKDDSDNVEIRKLGGTADFRFRTQSPLGYRHRSEHSRLRQSR